MHVIQDYILAHFCSSLYSVWPPKALLGNRYGHRTLPRVIPEKQFEVLLSKLSKSPDGVKQLNKWFLKDNNAVPPTYILQPITTHFPHYSDLRPESGSQRDENLLSWRLTETQVLQLLRSAATDAEAAGDITEEQKQLYFTSGQICRPRRVFVSKVFVKFDGGYLLFRSHGTRV